MAITDLWILNRSRNPFFFLFPEVKGDHDSFMLANFLGALESFTSELQRGRIDSIMFHNQMFYFLEENEFLFILMGSSHLPELNKKILEIVSSMFSKVFPLNVQKTLHETVIFPSDEVLFSLLRVWILDLLDLIENANSSWKYAFQFAPKHSDALILRTSQYFTNKMIQHYPKQSIFYYNKLVRLFEDSLDFSELLYMVGIAFGYTLQATMNKAVIIPTEKDVFKFLEPISILKYDNKNRIVRIHVCPFCRGITSDKPFCDFVRGVFQGVLRRDDLTIKETSCIAMGDKSCSFQLKYSNN